MIHGDLVLQNSHSVYNLKGLQNIDSINGEDLYLDRYALYITNNDNLAFVDKVNWSKITSSNEIFLDYTERLNRILLVKMNVMDVLGHDLISANVLIIPFLIIKHVTGVCENVLSSDENLCQVRPPNNLFVDYPHHTQTFM